MVSQKMNCAVSNSILSQGGNACNSEFLGLTKGNGVNIPQASMVSVWQHKQAQKHQRILLEEFSFLLNYLTQWN